MNDRDALYRILGLRPGASPKEIRSAYRRLIKLYHPDRDASLDAEVRYLEVRMAYEALTGGFPVKARSPARSPQNPQSDAKKERYFLEELILFTEEKRKKASSWLVNWFFWGGPTCAFLAYIGDRVGVHPRYRHYGFVRYLIMILWGLIFLHDWSAYSHLKKTLNGLREKLQNLTSKG